VPGKNGIDKNGIGKNSTNGEVGKNGTFPILRFLVGVWNCRFKFEVEV